MLFPVMPKAVKIRALKNHVRFLVQMNRQTARGALM